MTPEIDTFLDYIRIVSYAVVVLTSFSGLVKRKFSSLIFLGDIFLAVMLMATLCISSVFGGNLGEVADLLLTPAAVIWAVVHYLTIFK